MFRKEYFEKMPVQWPTGLFYLNDLPNGLIHRLPVDALRFYSDAGKALVALGKRNKLKSTMLEFYTIIKEGCNDFSRSTSMMWKLPMGIRRVSLLMEGFSSKTGLCVRTTSL